MALSKIGTAGLSSDAVGPGAVSDQANPSTGYFDLPAGTTAQRPGSPTSGATRFNTTTGSVEFYDGVGWISTNLIPSINSVTGTIYAGATSTLTLSLTNATDTITVRFSEGGSTIADVDDVAVSAGSASVAVPSAVFGQTAGDTIAVSILNLDGIPSSNAINKTVQALPTGGTITTSGGYRIHTFTSSSSFVIPSGLSLSNIEYLVIAGGAGGGYSQHGHQGGGGGAGGYRNSVTGETSGRGSSAEAKLTRNAGTYTVTVGSGGSGATGAGRGSSGSNSVFDTITSVGGGGGGNAENAGTDRCGLSGGAGGGSGGSDQSPCAGGAGTSGQGYDGGTGNQSFGGGGSGGGAGGAGVQQQNPIPSIAVSGGAGLASSITGSSVTRSSGGKVKGSSENFLIPGAANSGGGGAGGYSGASSPSGSNGGSGIVIVRYQL
jgi:hypothetical protein